MYAFARPIAVNAHQLDDDALVCSMFGRRREGPHITWDRRDARRRRAGRDEPALSKLGWPYCTVTLPGNAMGDIQVAGEYVVDAIR